MSSDIIRVPPERIRFKLDDVSDLQAPVWPGDWDMTRRSPLEATAKHRGIVQHFRDGVPWLETALFREIFAVRFAAGEAVAGCPTIEKLGELYDHRYDGLYAHLKAHGFVERIEGRLVKFPEVYLARDGEPILSNEGNHRVAMAKLLGLKWILAKVRTRHPEAPRRPFEEVTCHPVLPPGADDIPAMTTPAERYSLYLLAKQAAANGAIVELGAWMGAVTVYLAAGVRDSGIDTRVYTHDRFEWKPVHTVKAGADLTHRMLAQFRANLGDLGRHVTIRQGDFRDATWRGHAIGALVLDGPKRVKEIVKTLPIFEAGLRAGTLLAWQDFAHFPSFDLPAALTRWEDAGAVRFCEAVYPGTLAVFEMRRRFRPEELGAGIRLEDWGEQEIVDTWARWTARLPEGQRARFRCGAALFLCDRGWGERGAAVFRDALALGQEDIVRKWHIIRVQRPAYAARYPTLDAMVPA